jgi:hypothetical protein
MRTRKSYNQCASLHTTEVVSYTVTAQPGGVTASMTIICVLCTLRTLFLRSICNFTLYSTEIVSYTVTAQPGGVTASTTSSPATLPTAALGMDYGVACR